MRRREFIMLGGAAATWPRPASAQQGRMPVVGYLASNALAETQHLIAGFRKGLGEAGHAEGRTLSIVFLSCDGDYGRLPALAAELVSARADVIVAQGPPAAHAAKAATTTIPIVFATGTDPVADGLVDSLASPGGNRTGVAMFMTDLVTRRLDLLIELMPNARRFALLVNPNFPSPWVDSVVVLARARQVQLLILKATNDSEVDVAFARMLEERVEAFVVGQDPFLGLRPKVPEMSVRHRIPMMGFIRSHALQGALATYGNDLPDSFRTVGNIAGQILRGARPADLPVQRPTKFEMVLNLNTATALGVAIPQLLLARADEVIE